MSPAVQKLIKPFLRIKHRSISPHLPIALHSVSMPTTACIKKRCLGDLKHLGTIKRMNKQQGPALKAQVIRIIMVATHEGRCVVATTDTEPEETPTSSASTSSAIAHSSPSEDKATIEDIKPQVKMPNPLIVDGTSSASTFLSTPNSLLYSS
jgi:hypothetical protein